ncbi:hypothetical protein B5F07_18370 [Lachnoclostridium sp. An169]|uniref:hypothetical protein n=1 Tax=Lachnoclostridium sp. An169 TaxID=1965569 RepID=UPI000B3AA226|nr:hypothetical protein [Lachnoclostridium sp. An169]OUP81204.1 hypothetical protein B5F07_18370 [Lachnoclostridium sp. An169]
MTPIILLDRLEEFVKKVTGDIKLQVKVRNLNPEEEKERAANVYKMRLPKKEDQVQQIPYILLQFINGKDDKKEKEPEESMCAVRIVVATYSEDGGQGAYDLLNVILRIRSELEKAGIIGGQFVLQKPLEYIVYPDSTEPYYLGEMITNWSIPTIKREVEEIWQ